LHSRAMETELHALDNQQTPNPHGATEDP
jgi:hypothetical protein